MNQILETISKIKKARMALHQAIIDNDLAASPRMKDLGFIPKIYEIFEQLKGVEIKANDRKEFIFVIICLYSPNKFFGGKMPQGLRRAIAKATKVTCASAISTTCTELMVLYTTYSDFRQGVDKLMQEVLKRLN